MIEGLSPGQEEPEEPTQRAQLEAIAEARHLQLEQLREAVIDINDRLRFASLDTPSVTEITPHSGTNCTVYRVTYSSSCRDEPPSTTLELFSSIEIVRDEASMAFQDAFAQEEIKKRLSSSTPERTKRRMAMVHKLRHQCLTDRNGDPYRAIPNEETKRIKFKSHISRVPDGKDPYPIRAMHAAVVLQPMVEIRDHRNGSLREINLSTGQVKSFHINNKNVERHDTPLISGEDLAETCRAFDLLSEWLEESVIRRS